MLKRILHRIARYPWVYDRIQLLIGAKKVYRYLAAHVVPLTSGTSIVLDLGGGTGLYRSLWSSTTSYICLDIDNVKLKGYLKKEESNIALCANAASVSLKSNSVDVVMCIFVSHHLADCYLEQMLAESRRILKPKGVFIFSDAVWEPKNIIGRLIWRHDVGSYPRTAQHLHSGIAKYYEVTHNEIYSIYHQYIFCTGIKSFNPDQNLTDPMP